MDITAKYKVFDSLIEGVQVIGPSYEYLYVNNSLVRQAKSTRSRLIGSTMLKEYPGIEKTMVFHEISECMTKRDARNLVNEFEFPDGSKEWFEVSIQPVDEGVLILSFDITQLKLAEEKISSQYIRALEQKNQELEQFAAIVSHDLQAPLNTIINLVELLKNEIGQSTTNETIDTQLDFMASSTGRMKELIQGLLEHAQIGKNKEKQLVDCNHLVKTLLEDLGHLISERGAFIEVDDLPSVIGYKTELRLLFQNLIINAIKFGRVGHPPKVKLFSSMKDDFWEISISDNGIGIPKNAASEIFQIFKRLHPPKSYEGTGIGLAHCKKIVELHGGRISVESEVENGSTFRFTMPVVASPVLELS